MMRRLLALAALLGLAAAPVRAETILFVGNSFTFGAHSPVHHMGAHRVTDLNGTGVGGVPALFKRFTEQAGLDYDVSLETEGGRSLAWHLANRRAQIDRRWDGVVLQDYSTLNPQRPGDPAETIASVDTLARLFTARNPRVRLLLDSTWSRPDLTYRPGSPWSGQGIAAMANGVRAGYDRAARSAGAAVRGVAPVGQAFTCAIRAGVADADPYDGIAYGQLPLWAWDQYHASAYGYYLEALVLFGEITGRDPRSLGRDETAAMELGFSPEQTAALQGIAHEALETRGGCGR
jgi:hypothetical protein